MVSDMNETDNSVNRESPLKSKQDEILKECDRLINHFSRKAHESKRNFRSFKYASMILSAIVAILSTLQSIGRNLRKIKNDPYARRQVTRPQDLLQPKSTTQKMHESGLRTVSACKEAAVQCNLNGGFPFVT